VKTEFTAQQLLDPDTATSAKAIRKCVHCGFCTATCPTYVLLGDERDSPRGRIYLMKEMLEREQRPTEEVVLHIDRCLSCLSCTTTCPSGVDYMHLVDHSRAYIERNYRRPWFDRLLRWTLATILPHRNRFRWALRLGHLAAPLAGLIRRVETMRPVTAMLDLAGKNSAATAAAVDSPTEAQRRGRVLLMQGCAESVMRPEIRAATVRLLNRLGYDVVFAEGEGCCGALVHHMGREEESQAFVRRNVDLWTRTLDRAATEGEPIDAIIITTSGCGTLIKDYGFFLREDAAYSESAARVSALAKDISEFLVEAEIRNLRGGQTMSVAYHPACSLQHGQKITAAPKKLLEAAGFLVQLPADAHLCCGSAGSYNILQPQIAAELGNRKIATLEALQPQVIATGNVGCMVQLAARSQVAVVHTVELLDWATGGPTPQALDGQRRIRTSPVPQHGTDAR
jgi:glycolate oxidase iron-sulfur subunit